MKIQIRKGVFETNSSSMHSICIEGKSRMCEFKNYKGDDILASGGEFGWEIEEYTDWETKLQYVIVSMQYLGSNRPEKPEEYMDCTEYRWLTEVIKDYTGKNLVMNDDFTPGYIDHQSVDNLGENDIWLKNSDEQNWKSRIRDFIFDERFVLVTDNDNH
jgi:hypothetical protein